MIDRYAVIGHPIAHSKSPQIHAAFAEACGHAIRYERVEAPLDGFAATVRRLVAEGWRGANVTLPFKVEAAALADRRSARVAQAGAANALRFLPDGSIEAENFDGVGLVTDLVHNLGLALAGRRVLLLGAGGAARGAIGPLLEARPATLLIVNRTPAKAAQLAALFAAHPGAAALDGGGLERCAGGAFDVAINATPTGLAEADVALPAGSLAPGAAAYDMMYGKGLTPFLRAARGAGAGPLADGLGMLVEQAAEAFAWWRGVRPRTAPVMDALRVPLV
ncbi:MAG TPA: shikimate dehydrogenase [Burkholderiaceae bacterium]|nr:shikimate dehydrogenase [Burkholderiaceae bacterium]